MDHQGFGYAIVGLHERVNACERVLKDGSGPAAENFCALRRQGGDLGIVKTDVTVRNPDQPERCPSQRGLAAARLANDGNNFAGFDVQRYAVYSVDRLTAEESLADAEIYLDVIELDQRL